MNHHKLPFKPPLLVFLLVGLGFGLQALYPLPFWEHPSSRRLFASLLLLLGLLLMGASRRSFARGGEHFSHDKPTVTLVTSGPFRFSRNPVYLAMIVLIAALAVATNTAWLFFTFHLLGLPILHFFVVLPEERYLRSTLGQEFEDYCARTRRWI